ncbi:serine/threonine kinase-like domain-containing protein STKLD1 [Pseudophryne corroboree]|uniref:serine/threonine kinase-like domain-containing protein STKLD1 n=1 Tax=Pseudophryne corroboree TaxID=495146 RepID=UPI0030816E1E
MDRYQVLEEWGAGAFGVTCLVEEIGGGRRFAVKKVECADEREGNLALEEGKSLLELRHPSVCAYKECFLAWDSKISSLFCCLVMDYCDRGNLAGIVQVSRERKTITDEKMIQRFLGHVMSALVYIHSKNVTHRNIKPSNILLNNDDVFVISDFLPEALATDYTKMNIRVDAERNMFLSPESLRFVYGERSVVWSVGCVLLDLMSTSIYSEAEITAALLRIRTDASALHGILQTIRDHVEYSEDLYQLLPEMLKIQPAERPRPADLVPHPYIRKCLTVIGSPLAGVKKKLPPGAACDLTDGGVEDALAFMKRYTDYEDAQLLALRHLAGDTGDGFLDAGEAIRLVSQAVVTHRDSVSVQREGGRMLHRLLSQVLERGDNEACLTSRDLIFSLVDTVRTFPEDPELVSVTLRMMTMLSVSEVAAGMLVTAGFLPDLVRLLEGPLEDRETWMSCCALLWSWSMIVTENQTDEESLQQAVPVISTLIQKHGSDGELVESACAALWTLCLKGHVTEEQVEPITLLLLESLRTHKERPLLSKNVCLALTSLALKSELSVYRLLVPTAGKSALSVIKEVYRLHAEDPDVVENICLLLSELAHYGTERSY